MPYRTEAEVIFLFGAGTGAKLWLERSPLSSKSLLIIDNDSSKWGTHHAGIEVVPPNSVKELDFRLVVVLVSDVQVVTNQLREMGVPKRAIDIPPKTTFRPQPFQTERERASALRILDTLVKTAEAAELLPIVEQGAALGIYRDGDLIPWDNDFDISFPMEASAGVTQFASLIDGLGEFSAPEITLTQSGIQIYFEPKHQPIPISVYSRRQSGKVSVSADAAFLSVSAEAMWPPTYFKCRDFCFPIPHKPEIYFASIYGPDWRKPRPDFSFGDYPQALP